MGSGVPECVMTWWRAARPGVADGSTAQPASRDGAGLLPGCHAAQVRLLHRATGANGLPARWADVAEQTGARLHALARFDEVAGRPVFDARAPRGWPGENPVRGSLDPEQLEALRDALLEVTPGAVCTLLVWDGWSSLRPPWRDAPRVERPGRSYVSLEGALEDVVRLSAALAGDDADGGLVDAAHPAAVQTPAAWWPQDETWSVATEVDLDSTLVAGTAELVARLLADPVLEAFPVRPEDEVSLRR